MAVSVLLSNYSLQLQHIVLLARLVHNMRWETSFQNGDYTISYYLPGGLKRPSFLKHFYLLLCL